VSEKLSMNKLKEILRMKWCLGHPHREIARSVKVSAGSVSRCVQRALSSGLTWDLVQDMDEEAIHSHIYGKPKQSSVATNTIDWPYVRTEFAKKGVTLQLLWHEYKEKNPDGLSYGRFCNHYRQWEKKLDVTLRQPYKAGEKVLVDYSGLTFPVINAATGEIANAEIFVGVMGASNRIYVEASKSQGLEDWLNAHVHMFEYYGGTPEIVVPDNLKSGVTTANRYEPDINPSYMELAEHYGIAVIPTRVAKPQDKAKVEQAVQHVQRHILAPLRNRQCFSIYELNQMIKPLLEKVNAAPFQKLEGSRNSEFKKIDKPALKSLPQQRYQFAAWKKAKVNIDYHIELNGHYYSVPYKYVRQKVDVRSNQYTTEIFVKGKRIASHRYNQKKGGHTTQSEHMPKSHQAYLQWDNQRIIAWAEQQGHAVALLSEKIMQSRPHPQQGYRSCMGLMRLGKDYGSHRLTAACQRALDIGSYSYKSVQSILKNNLDQRPLPDSPPTNVNVMHEHIRGSEYFM
jgi:transposase